MLACWTCLAASADARQTAEAAATAEHESDPIACWWRTDRRAVHVGEHFTLTLTCSALETSNVRAVTDRDRLDPAALDLTPFEILGGARPDDMQAPPRRYFQYSYTLRLLGDELFGRDVDIPSIPITYNIETSGVTGTRGRDQLYLLPPLSVRLLSLVPPTATDIQDATPDTFGDTDRRAFRATGELAAAGLLFTFAAALAGVAVMRVARPRVARATSERGPLSTGEMLRGCAREAVRVKSEAARTGWSGDLIGAALTVLRIAGSLALGRPVAQRVVDGSTAQEGQLAIRTGALRAQRVLISSATTSASVAARLANLDGSADDPRLRLALDELGESLRVFAAAAYGRTGALDTTALDASLDAAIDALGHLSAMQPWPARAADTLSSAAERMKGAVWDR